MRVEDEEASVEMYVTLEVRVSCPPSMKVARLRDVLETGEVFFADGNEVAHMGAVRILRIESDAAV